VASQAVNDANEARKKAREAATEVGFQDESAVKRQHFRTLKSNALMGKCGVGREIQTLRRRAQRNSWARSGTTRFLRKPYKRQRLSSRTTKKLIPVRSPTMPVAAKKFDISRSR